MFGCNMFEVNLICLCLVFYSQEYEEVFIYLGLLKDFYEIKIGINIQRRIINDFDFRRNDLMRMYFV